MSVLRLREARANAGRRLSDLLRVLTVWAATQAESRRLLRVLFLWLGALFRETARGFRGSVKDCLGARPVIRCDHHDCPRQAELEIVLRRVRGRMRSQALTPYIDEVR